MIRTEAMQPNHGGYLYYVMPIEKGRTSSESGRDNPFRPDGDISKEADEIVQMIKSGRPLEASAHKHINGDDAPDASYSPSSPAHENAHEPMMTASPAEHPPLSQQLPKATPSSPQKKGAGANGSAAPPEAPPGPVEVKHATLAPSEPAQVEHVVLKKKNKCSCCVIQ